MNAAQLKGKNKDDLERVRKELMSKEVTFNTPLPEKHTFHDVSDRFKDRQEQVGKPIHDIEFSFAAPVLLNLISDWHVGHPTTNYLRIEQELEIIKETPMSFVFLLGDMIDNLNWNPGQFDQMEQTPEQITYMRSAMQYLADYHKLLLVVLGDHDGWLTKAGFNPLSEAPERYGAHATQGITQVKAKVQNAEYKIGVAHQLPGSSMYNKTHPQVRAERFGGLRGSDIIASGHNHQKGYSTDYQQNFEGTREVHYVALGPYKEEDSWLAKKGFKHQDDVEMFGSAIKLEGKKKKARYYADILEANKEHGETG